MLARLFFKYGNLGPISGILSGLRPAVVALICAASVSFVFLALWNTETVPADFSKIDWLGALILALSLFAIRRKVGVIRVLAGSGVLGLCLGLLSM